MGIIQLGKRGGQVLGWVAVTSGSGSLFATIRLVFHRHPEVRKKAQSRYGSVPATHSAAAGLTKCVMAAPALKHTPMRDANTLGALSMAR
jgi:hypothetical protein